MSFGSMLPRSKRHSSHKCFPKKKFHKKDRRHHKKHCRLVSSWNQNW